MEVGYIKNGPGYFDNWINCFSTLVSCLCILGMSTIPEVQMANYLGMRVFAFSLITNMCVRTYGEYSRLQGEPNDEVSEGVSCICVFFFIFRTFSRHCFDTGFETLEQFKKPVFIFDRMSHNRMKHFFIFWKEIYINFN